MKKSIGIDVEAPKDTCTDENCPFHGTLSVRGNFFRGEVVSDSMQKTVTVEWTRRVYVPKVERYLLKKTRVKAHNPSCIGAEKGDKVLIGETRPLSKSKNFVVLQKL